MKDTIFKEEFNVEQYYCMILSPLHRAAFCKFRCGVAPIYEGHVLFNCHLYEDIRLAD